MNYKAQRSVAGRLALLLQSLQMSAQLLGTSLVVLGILAHKSPARIFWTHSLDQLGLLVLGRSSHEGNMAPTHMFF